MQTNNDSSSPQKRQRRDDILWLKDEAFYTHVENSDVPLQVKLLCGADLLESFGTPGVWKEEDVSRSS
jgi:nicotinamide mononucleotide adenylyltransferase